MKVYELFLLLLLLCSITIQHKNNGIVRKLQDDDNDSDITTEDTVESGNESSGSESEESSGSESEESSGSESEESSGSESEESSGNESEESSGSESEESSGSEESLDTSAPTNQPTETPTSQPTETPTSQPTETPTSQPTETPTSQPTETPTSQPTETPTSQPTETPTSQPTDAPTTSHQTDAPTTSHQTDAPTTSHQTDVPTSGNKTIDETDKTDDGDFEPVASDISDPEPSSPPPKVVLVGFGRFRKPRRVPRGPLNVVLITFVIYFQKINGDTPLSRHMNVGLNMFYHRRLRALQEQVNANCSRASGDKEDFVAYNCEAPADENRELGQIECLNNFQFEGQSAVEMEVSSFANSTKDDLMSQSEVIQPIVLLNNTKLEVLGLNFTLDGFKNRDFNGEPGKVVMSFDESRGEGELKNATCYVQKKSEKEYKLNCGSEDSISAPLNGANGIASTGQKVMIYMADGEETTLNTGLNHQSLYERGSSSGLSGGAIAAIVIALVVALIAVAVIVIALMSKKTAAAAAPFQESTLGINTNSISQ